MPRRKACAAVAPVEEVRPKILGARVLLTLDGPDGPASLETELPPAALELLESVAEDTPTVDEVATAAQELAQLRLVLLSVDRTLLGRVDAAAGLLRRFPGVAAELQRRQIGAKR